MSAPPLPVAVDLLGGDHAPAQVLDGVLLALAADPDLRVVLVGPPDVARTGLRDRGAADLLDGAPPRVLVSPASQVIEMTEDPARGVRAKRDATVRVAARLVRDGAAGATVSVGSSGAAMAAGLFTLGRLPGISRPALAAVLPALRSPVVLLDVGATTECTAELLAQFALAGAALAQCRLGTAEPRVGLLSIGTEAGKGDQLRKDSEAALAALPVDFRGLVEADAAVLGGVVDVVVTDGFTGNVLIKGLEAAVLRVLAEVEAQSGSVPSAEVARISGGVAAALGPQTQAGAVLLGVRGVSVVGHGAASPLAVAACIRAAAALAAEGLVPNVGTRLAELSGHRPAVTAAARR